MNYLLDTNVLAETIKTTPSRSVTDWLNSVPQDSLHVSVLTLGEVRKGVEKMSSGKRKSTLIAWLEDDLINWFSGKIVPIDLKVADHWGYICAQSKKPVPAIDSLIAATALVHNLRLVTRNIKDFDYPGLQVINPWQ